MIGGVLRFLCVALLRECFFCVCLCVLWCIDVLCLCVRVCLRLCFRVCCVARCCDVVLVVRLSFVVVLLSVVLVWLFMYVCVLSA